MNGRTYLREPAKDNDRGGEPLLVTPEPHGRFLALGLCHVVAADGGTRLGDLLLRRRVGHAPAVMWCVYPPHYGEEDEPCGVEDVVGEEQVREVQGVLSVLLVWSDDMSLPRCEDH